VEISTIFDPSERNRRILVDFIISRNADIDIGVPAFIEFGRSNDRSSDGNLAGIASSEEHSRQFGRDKNPAAAKILEIDISEFISRDFYHGAFVSSALRQMTM